MLKMSQTKTFPSLLAKVKAGVAAEAIAAVRAQKTKERAMKMNRIYLTLRYWMKMVFRSEMRHLCSQECKKVKQKIALSASMLKMKMRVDLHSKFQTAT